MLQRVAVCYIQSSCVERRVALAQQVCVYVCVYVSVFYPSDSKHVDICGVIG